MDFAKSVASSGLPGVFQALICYTFVRETETAVLKEENK